MPWCPECGSEYREGIERCPACGVRLVEQQPPTEARERRPLLAVARWRRSFGRLAAKLNREPEWELPPLLPKSAAAPSEEALPPGPEPYPWEAVGRWLVPRWPGFWSRFRAGLWLLPHSLWRTMRMRQVWVVLALLAALAAGTALPRIQWASREGPLSRAWTDVDALMWFSAAGQARSAWASPYTVVAGIATGIGEPLRPALDYPDWVLQAMVVRAVGWRARGTQWMGRILYGATLLIASMVIALLQAGLYGWLTSQVTTGQVAAARAWGRARRSLLSLFWWRLLLIALFQLTWQLLQFGHSWWTVSYGDIVARGTAALLIAPLALAPFVMVCHASGLWAGVVRALRLLVARWPTVVALFVVIRLAYGIAGVAELLLGSRTGTAYWWAAEVGGMGGLLVGVASVLVARLVWAAVALSLCTAYALIVVRSAPATPAAPLSGADSGA